MSITIPEPTKAQLESELQFVEAGKKMCQEVLKEIIEREKQKKETKKKK